MPARLLRLHARRQVEAYRQVGVAVDVLAAEPGGGELGAGIVAVVAVLVDHSSHAVNNHVYCGGLSGSDRRIAQPHGYAVIAFALIVRPNVVNRFTVHIGVDVRPVVVAVGQTHVNSGNVVVSNVAGEGEPVL